MTLIHIHELNLVRIDKLALPATFAKELEIIADTHEIVDGRHQDI
jgi:hypothetical protein